MHQIELASAPVVMQPSFALNKVKALYRTICNLKHTQTATLGDSQSLHSEVPDFISFGATKFCTGRVKTEIELLLEENLKPFYHFYPSSWISPFNASTASNMPPAPRLFSLLNSELCVNEPLPSYSLEQIYNILILVKVLQYSQQLDKMVELFPERACCLRMELREPLSVLLHSSRRANATTREQFSCQ